MYSYNNIGNYIHDSCIHTFIRVFILSYIHTSIRIIISFVTHTIIRHEHIQL